MTDQLGALAALANHDGPERARPGGFLRPLAARGAGGGQMAGLQATSWLPGTLDVVKALMAHEAFNLRNPNKVRALIGAFCQANPVHFHAARRQWLYFPGRPGLGFERIQSPDRSAVDGAFTRWRKYDPIRQRGCGIGWNGSWRRRAIAGRLRDRRQKFGAARMTDPG
jgi:aminopeptidase N